MAFMQESPLSAVPDRQRDAWRAARLAELLDVPYCHLVFTLPHEINALAAVHARWVYDTLMQCTAATLTEFAANERWLGGIGAFTLVLHTWTQDLRRHPHVHALMACGALQCNAGPMAGRCRLGQAQAVRALPVPGSRLVAGVPGQVPAMRCSRPRRRRAASRPAGAEQQRRQRLQRSSPSRWVVYAKTPLAGAAAVLGVPVALHASHRHRQRTTGGHRRRQGAAARARRRHRRQAHHRHRRRRFIGRFLQHVLPPGFKRIRHYGLLAPATKADRLAAARMLAMPAPNPKAIEDAQAFMRRVAAIEISCARTANSATGSSCSSCRPTALRSGAMCRAPSLAEDRHDTLRPAFVLASCSHGALLARLVHGKRSIDRALAPSAGW